MEAVAAEGCGGDDGGVATAEGGGGGGGGNGWLARRSHGPHRRGGRHPGPIEMIIVARNEQR